MKFSIGLLSSLVKLKSIYGVNMGIIYKAVNKITGKTYVGATRYSLDKRWNEHVRSSETTENRSKFHKAIRKYGDENFDVEVIEEVPNDMLAEREVANICHYDSYYNGYNSTLGGPGYNQIEYEKVQDLWDRGYNCRKIAELLDIAPGTVYKALEDYDAYSTAESMRRGKSNQMHKVRQYDFDGNLIAEYESTAAAARAYDVDRTLISAVCRHKRPSGVGYRWEYADDNASDFFYLESKKPKRVYQCTLDGEIVNSFASMMDASRIFGINRSAISACCSGRQRTAGGYIWRYADE